MYLNNSVFVGVFDWQSNSGLDDWGEHHLHILPNGDIGVIWINKSVEKEAKGRLIWTRPRLDYQKSKAQNLEQQKEQAIEKAIETAEAHPIPKKTKRIKSK